MDKLIIFLAGAGIGGFLVWQFTKEYYQRLADEEIESVLNRDRFKSEEPEPEKEDPDVSFKVYKALTENYTKPPITDYAAKYEEKEEPDEEDEKLEEAHPLDDYEDQPYVIKPEEFGELEEYDKISLTYYADGFLVDGDDIIDNVEAVVGPDALDSIGLYEDDCVHVRNDKYGTDYEILLSEMNFRE